MAGSAYTGQAPYYDYIDMICIHSYDSIKTGMDILIGSSLLKKVSNTQAQ
jgi:hypothetical protein